MVFNLWPLTNILPLNFLELFCLFKERNLKGGSKTLHILFQKESKNSLWSKRSLGLKRPILLSTQTTYLRLISRKNNKSEMSQTGHQGGIYWKDMDIQCL